MAQLVLPTTYNSPIYTSILHGIHEKRRGKKVAKGVPVGLFLLQEKKSHRHVASIGLLGAIHI